MGVIKHRAAMTFRSLGYDVRRVGSREEARWGEQVRGVRERRTEQTCDDARALAERYREPVFGPIGLVELLGHMAGCIDVGDADMGLVSQLVHSLQFAEALHDAGHDDPDLTVAALLHDVGKLLLLVADDPADVVGPTRLIADGGTGAGLDRCTFQWGADEYADLRLVEHVPDHVAWLVRYHGLAERNCKPFMDDRDLDYTDRYLKVFQRLDCGSKSWSHLPSRGLDDYRPLLEEWFPDPIVF